MYVTLNVCFQNSQDDPKHTLRIHGYKLLLLSGQDGAVGIATHYMLDSLLIESWNRWHSL